MHVLSSHNRSEFLACPELIRLDYVDGSEGYEPTLLIKGSTLLLKYIVLGAPMQLAFVMCDGRLLCALKVLDDGNSGGVVWSVVEREQELNGIRALARGEPLFAFLFNELAVNVARTALPTLGKLDKLHEWANRAALGGVDYPAIQAATGPLLERLFSNLDNDDNWVVLDIGGKSEWKPIRNYFITSGASSSLIDIFDNDEGNQQEQLGVWLTDNLHPLGVHHSPQIPKGNGTRELTDILLSHEHGSVLIESKTLAVLTRGTLPNRAKLAEDVAAHIDKAFKQLRGAIRKLKANTPVTTLKGDLLVVEREAPAHAIVLIPNLDLVRNRDAYGIPFIRDFMEATGGFPHLIDIAELLRIVQAAEIIAERDKTGTLMMAFDYYLVERAKKAVESRTLCIEVLFRGLPASAD